jgi:hypothetical protein
MSLGTFSALLVRFDDHLTAKHEAIAVVTPHSVHDSQTLQQRTFSFSFARRSMTRNLEQIEHPVQQLCDRIVRLASTNAMSSHLAWLSHAIGDEEQLDVQMQQRQDALKNHYLH